MRENFSKFFDHTLLRSDATEEDIKKICREAIEYDFCSVCVNSCHVPLVAGMLKDTDVKTCCVVGFPLGAMSSMAKVFETRIAVEHGAQEIDMVINVGYLKAGAYDKVKEDISGVVKAAGKDAIVKVIIETCLLTNEEKVKACRLAVEAGAAFVKTSTGFAAGGAMAEDVRLMRETVGEGIGVKASGGIRDYETAVRMIEAGANRIGASATTEIVKGHCK
ncbi:MAG: deoxyribose-phosphate aldolase [Catenibacillus sp.]